LIIARVAAIPLAMFAATPPDSLDPATMVRVGRIVSVDRAAATCIVSVGDPDADEIQTAAIDWLPMRAGKTIIWSPPSEGEQVLLLCPEGDIAQGVAIPGLYSDVFPAPGDGAREFIRFDDGAEFGYDTETHAADITLPEGATLTIIATGGITIEGDVTLTGKLTASDDVIASGVSLKMHTHGQTQPGSGQTGAPA
jgi:phage baseplate assembly protein V